MTKMTLSAQVAALAAAQAQQGEAITALTGTLTALVGALTQGQFSTPTLVAQATAPKTAPKGAKKASAKVAQPVADEAAKAAKKAAQAQAWAQVKADRAALSPLNKAMSALGCKGDAWPTRFADEVLVATALKALSAPERKAAKEALARKAG
jgi:multidrug efflux pump subunit AcrA (membrane-fusion protein)